MRQVNPRNTIKWWLKWMYRRGACNESRQWARRLCRANPKITVREALSQARVSWLGWAVSELKYNHTYHNNTLYSQININNWDCTSKIDKSLDRYNHLGDDYGTWSDHMDRVERYVNTRDAKNKILYLKFLDRFIKNGAR